METERKYLLEKVRKVAIVQLYKTTYKPKVHHVLGEGEGEGFSAAPKQSFGNSSAFGGILRPLPKHHKTK